MTTPHAKSAVDPAVTVNEVLVNYPSTVSVFNQFGIDACCGGAASLDDVVRRTLTTQSTASEVVARLVSRGLVTSEPAENDRRRVALRVTPAGDHIIAVCEPPVQDTLIVALRSLPAPQQEAIADGLAAWLAAANLAGVAPSMFFESDESPQPHSAGIASR